MSALNVKATRQAFLRLALHGFHHLAPGCTRKTPCNVPAQATRSIVFV